MVSGKVLFDVTIYVYQYSCMFTYIFIKDLGRSLGRWAFPSHHIYNVDFCIFKGNLIP